VGTKTVVRGRLPDTPSWPSIRGTDCARARRRHLLSLLTVSCDVLEPLAAEAALRQLAGCHLCTVERQLKHFSSRSEG
jgi:hypothetical protein